MARRWGTIATKRIEVPPEAPSKQLLARNIGIDWLRAWAILMVVVLHADPVQLMGGVDGSAPYPARMAAFVFLFYVEMMAVPVFYLVSLWLFIPRARARGWSYTSQRVLRLGLIYVAWVAIYFLLAWLTHSQPLWPGWTVSLTGGPDILGSGSVLYFLLNLTLLTLVAGVYVLLPEELRDVLAMSCVLASAFWFEWAAMTRVGVSYRNPLQFLVLIPLADLLTHPELRRKAIPWLWGLFAFFVIHDLFDPLLHHTSEYGRMSAVIGAAAIVATVLARTVPQSGVIDWVSRHSLGAYAIHKPMIAIFAAALPYTIVVSILGVQYSVFQLVVLVLACAATITLVAGLSRSRLSPLVR